MKVLAHTHTIFSNDGELTPQELAELAHRHGFDAVLVSDHFEDLTEKSFSELVNQCNSISECLMIPGYERSWNGYHILALGVYDWFSDSDLDIWADAVRNYGGMTVLAHPSKYRFCITDEVLAVCDGVETWNSKMSYDGSWGPDPCAVRLLRPNQLSLCGQDLHSIRHLSSVVIYVGEQCKTAKQILERLKHGEYYMTNGFLRYGRELSVFSYFLLSVFHFFRRYARDLAIKLTK